MSPPIAVTGASGFIGRALVPALVARGHQVRALSRQPQPSAGPAVEWRVCDLLDRGSLQGGLAGAAAAFYLVHSMGPATGGAGQPSGGEGYAELERRSAKNFADAAERAGLERIVYLGGPRPARGNPSPHLSSRLAVGEILRAGRVPAVELRASMVIGAGSASWQIVRDLALRLPAMVLPRWLKSRTMPVAEEDVVAALAGALALPLDGSVIYDLPGPELLSGKEILQRIAALRGRRVPSIDVPLLTPWLSALWLKLVTRADFTLARELVGGLTEDLLPADDHYWRLIGHPDRLGFDEAARRALAAQPGHSGPGDRLASLEERLVEAVSPRLQGGSPPDELEVGTGRR